MVFGLKKIPSYVQPTLVASTDSFAQQNRIEDQKIAKQPDVIAEKLRKLDLKFQKLARTRPDMSIERTVRTSDEISKFQNRAARGGVSQISRDDWYKRAYKLAKQVSGLTCLHVESCSALKIKELAINSLDCLMDMLQYQLAINLFICHDWISEKLDCKRHEAFSIKSEEKIEKVFEKIIKTLDLEQKEIFYQKKAAFLNDKKQIQSLFHKDQLIEDEKERCEDQKMTEYRLLTSEKLKRLDKKVKRLNSKIACQLAKQRNGLLYHRLEKDQSLEELNNVSVEALDSFIEILEIQLNHKLLVCEGVLSEKSEYKRHEAFFIQSEKKIRKIFQEMLKTLDPEQKEKMLNQRKNLWNAQETVSVCLKTHLIMRIAGPIINQTITSETRDKVRPLGVVCRRLLN